MNKYVPALLLLCALPLLASTGPNPPINLHHENVTTVGYDACWDTAQPATSIVLISDIPPQDGYETQRQIAPANNPLVTHHCVAVDHQMPYAGAPADQVGDGQLFVYAAGVDAQGNMSTGPGPADGQPANKPLLMRTLATNLTGAPQFQLYLDGPNRVYAGNDLWLSIRPALTAGPIGDLYIVRGSQGDAVVKGTGGNLVGKVGSVLKLGAPPPPAHVQCSYDTDGIDAHDQVVDTTGPKCPNGNNSHDIKLRVRTAPVTRPGPYTVTFKAETNGVTATVQARFMVLPAPAAVHQALEFPPIPALDAFMANATTLGITWANKTDANNLAGIFNIFISGINFEGGPGFNDGGRSMVNLLQAHPQDAAFWQHAANALLKPYAENIINGGLPPAYDMYTSGMRKNWEITGDPEMKAGIFAIADSPYKLRPGGVNGEDAREKARKWMGWLDAEAAGHSTNPNMKEGIDLMKGNMVLFSQSEHSHAFMIGMEGEALINDYWRSCKLGHCDYSDLAAIKTGADALWARWWNPGKFYFSYNVLDLPKDFPAAPGQDTRQVILNPLAVAAMYGCYYAETGDQTALARGDIAWQHAGDNYDTLSYSGKQWAQYTELAWLFIGCRSGKHYSDVDVLANPYGGPWPDTQLPLLSQVNCDPNFGGCHQGTIGSTQAIINWQTWKDANSVIQYGTTPALGQSTQVNATMLRSHSQVIPGLARATHYFFKPCSTDALGHQACNQTLTFTTLP